MNKIKELILGYLRKFLKACNPIRWLGYVRPEEVLAVPSPTDTVAHSSYNDLKLAYDEMVGERNSLLEEVKLLQERIDEWDCYTADFD
jgi:hypothetical protein